MIRGYSFARAEDVLARAAAAGLREGAETLAGVLRTGGERVLVNSAGAGTVQVIVEGPSVVTREFGTITTPANPIAGEVLRLAQPRIAGIMARALRDALRGGA